MRKELAFTTALALFSCLSLCAQQSSTPSAATPSAARQSESDEYTRYELLAPGSARFRIVYEVSATTPGAQI